MGGLFLSFCHAPFIQTCLPPCPSDTAHAPSAQPSSQEACAAHARPARPFRPNKVNRQDPTRLDLRFILTPAPPPLSSLYAIPLRLPSVEAILANQQLNESSEEPIQRGSPEARYGRKYIGSVSLPQPLIQGTEALIEGAYPAMHYHRYRALFNTSTPLSLQHARTKS